MMKLIKFVMISCEKATFLISKKEEGKLKLGERIKLSSHLSMCKFCKLFEKQSSLISRHTKNLHSSDELSVEHKSEIAKALEQS